MSDNKTPIQICIEAVEKITKGIEESIWDSGEDLQLKTNEQLIEMIIEFGFGESEFHTMDIERILRENEIYKAYFEKFKPE